MLELQVHQRGILSIFSLPQQLLQLQHGTQRLHCWTELPMVTNQVSEVAGKLSSSPCNSEQSVWAHLVYSYRHHPQLIGLTASSSPYPSQNRILVIYDKQCDGAQPSISEVLSVDNFISPLNLANSDRFVVLADEISDSMQSSSMPMSVKRYIKCNLPVIYQGTSNSVTSISTGAIWMLVSNNGGISTSGNTNNLDVYTRIRYIDN